jgi:hypothetical protein
MCVKYGYCIPPEAAEAIAANPPTDPDGFVDAVLVAEGLEPMLVDKNQRRQLREVVTAFLEFE